MYLELIVGFLDDYNYETGNKYNVFLDKDKRQYIVHLKEEYIKYLPLIREIAKDFPKIENKSFLTSTDFKNFYESNLEKIKEVLKEKDILENSSLDIAELIFWESLNLSRIAPFFYDDKLDEIYIIGEDSNIYVNHNKLGNLKTDIALSHIEISSFIRFLEFVKGEGLYSTGGILEVDINHEKFHFRILIDSPSLTYGDFVFCIRNLRRFYYNLKRLIEIESISPEVLSILLIATYLRMNIIIAGPPNSGKTTLMNALVSMLPNFIRKISIEDAKEIIDTRRRGNHIVFYRSSGLTRFSKREQVQFTLRRSPEYLIIGETLTEEDTETLFYSLSMGLNVITTIHAYSIDSLIRRWLLYEGVEENALKDLDLIVVMEKEFEHNIRKVQGVYEIIEDSSNISYKKLPNKYNGLDNSRYINKVANKLSITHEEAIKLYYNILNSIKGGTIPTYSEFLSLTRR